MLVTLLIVALAATFIGGLAPFAQHLLSRAGLWRIFAFRSGILVSVTFMDLLPEAWHHHPHAAGWGALFGFGLFYAAQTVALTDACPEYLEECTTHVLGLAGLVGLFIHSFMDGFNLPISFAAGQAAGLAVGAALALHKLADGFTLTSLFGQAGWSRAASLGGLCLVAAATPLGSWVSYLGMARLSSFPSAALLGFAGGSFLYIGAAEILPRLHRARDWAAIACFLAGIAAMACLHRLT